MFFHFLIFYLSFSIHASHACQATLHIDVTDADEWNTHTHTHTLFNDTIHTSEQQHQPPHPLETNRVTINMKLFRVEKEWETRHAAYWTFVCRARESNLLPIFPARDKLFMLLQLLLFQLSSLAPYFASLRLFFVVELSLDVWMAVSLMGCYVGRIQLFDKIHSFIGYDDTVSFAVSFVVMDPHTHTPTYTGLSTSIYGFAMLTSHNIAQCCHICDRTNARKFPQRTKMNENAWRRRRRKRRMRRGREKNTRNAINADAIAHSTTAMLCLWHKHMQYTEYSIA